LRFLIFGWDFPYRQDSGIIIGGGQQAHAFFIARELAKQHEVVALSIGYPQASHHEVIDGVEIFRFGRWEKKAQIWEAVFLNFKLLVEGFKLGVALIESRKPDFIISWQTPIRPVAFLFSKMYKIPFIATTHGLGGVTPLLQDFFRKRKSFKDFIRLLQHIPDMLVIRSADLIEVATINWAKEKLVDHLGVNPEKCFISGNGVDIEKYDYSEDKENLIVFVGALTARKRVDMAIRIFERVREKTGDSSLRFCVIGDGPERENLMKMAPFGVEFTGFASESEKIEMLKRAKIYINCSYDEVFNIPIAEAFACGAIPVLYDLPTHREVLRGHGYLFKSEQEAVDICTHLLCNEEERRKLARAGRKFVEENYTWEMATKRFLEGLFRRFPCVNDTILRNESGETHFPK